MFWDPEEKHMMLSGSGNEANVMKSCQLKLKSKMLGRFQDTVRFMAKNGFVSGRLFWMWGPYICGKD